LSAFYETNMLCYVRLNKDNPSRAFKQKFDTNTLVKPLSFYPESK